MTSKGIRRKFRILILIAILSIFIFPQRVRACYSSDYENLSTLNIIHFFENLEGIRSLPSSYAAQAYSPKFFQADV